MWQNRYDGKCAHVCVGSGGVGENLSRVLPKMSLSSNVKIKHVRAQRTQCVLTPFNCYCAHMCYPTIVTTVRDKRWSFTTSNSKQALTLCFPRCAHRWMFELRREAVVKSSLSANTAETSRQSCDMSLC